MNYKNIIIAVLIVVVGAFIISYMFSNQNSASGNEGVEEKEKITVYKSMNCGCCGNYVSYLKKKGFEVEVINVDNTSEIKNQEGVPSDMSSCHTSLIAGYFVEGHVPVEAINKLLEEKPDIKGIALPEMPSASPGMPGAKQGPFQIFSVSEDGSTNEFMSI